MALYKIFYCIVSRVFSRKQ